MSDVHTIERLLLAKLRQHHLLSEPVDVDTDLIETGQLDSLVVMDLVGFVAATFGLKMLPQEISPENLRTVRKLAQFVAGSLRVSGQAA